MMEANSGERKQGIEQETRDEGDVDMMRDENDAMDTDGIKKRKRRPSQSNDGDNDDDGMRTATMTDADSSAPRPKLSIRERRASTSPQKFNTGQFEPLPKLKTSVEDAPAKKRRVNANFNITYDSAGTPRFQNFSHDGEDAADGPQDATLSAAIGSTVPSFGTFAPDVTGAATNLSLADPPTTSTPDVTKFINNLPKRKFNLIDEFCRDNSLLLHMVSYLSIPSVISLYSISKPFHGLFNRHHTAFILSIMRTWAPDADKIYPWRCYKSLCTKDPTKRQKVRLQGREDEVKRQWADLRDVPTLRWLQMVVWREGVCRDMLIQLQCQGLRCPPGTLSSLKRMWFILDLPLNAHRIALIHSRTYVTDLDLERMTFFLLRVDMLFTDPTQAPWPINHPNQRLHPNRFAGGCPTGVPLRKLLLAERNFTPLWRVIRGWSWDPKEPQRPLTRLDVLRLYVRHKYTPPADTPELVKKQSIMGIPWYEVGSGSLERTGVSFHDLGDNKRVSLAHPSISGSGITADRQKQLLYPHRRHLHLSHEKPREILLRPDELVIREGIRRKMKLHEKWADMMLWGFCDQAGIKLPIWSEEDMLRFQKGLPPKAQEEAEKKKMQVAQGQQQQKLGAELKTPTTAMSGLNLGV